MDLFACLLRRYSDRRGSDIASLVLGYEPIMEPNNGILYGAEFLRTLLRMQSGRAAFLAGQGFRARLRLSRVPCIARSDLFNL